MGSALFVVVAPGMVAGVIPWWISRWSVDDGLPSWLPLRVLGGLLLAAGALVVLQTVARFAVEGVGTPAPAAPTEHLVVGGLYRYVRNPMYLAVAAVIVGQALLLRHPLVLLYGVVVTTVNAAFVRLYEEPALRRQFGESYDAYRQAVPGWFPNLPKFGGEWSPRDH